jgi:hypothetical protein
MSLLAVRHVTIYRYSELVRLGQHRIMFRPRESHDLKRLSTSSTIPPNPARLRWLHDVFDNSKTDPCRLQLHQHSARMPDVIPGQHSQLSAEVARFSSSRRARIPIASISEGATIKSKRDVESGMKSRPKHFGAEIVTTAQCACEFATARAAVRWPGRIWS